MEPEYSVEVQPLLMLKLNNIPEKKFNWRGTSSLGMPQVWLEEELAHRFQVPAGAYLELRLVDVKEAILVDNFRVRLSNSYTEMHPVIGGKRQVKPALLEVSDRLKRDGNHPYTATLTRLGMPAPIIREKPSSASGNYLPPRRTYQSDPEEENVEKERRTIVISSR
ncbi:MAG: hypothetical protein HY438_01470 [DPANN group archaeon]|nr:hypothetical protein [DPANN group archaeon]